MHSLKCCHFRRNAVLQVVFFFQRTVSYSDSEAIMTKRSARVDYDTLNRWMLKFPPMVAARAQPRKRPKLRSWRMDETCLSVCGRWAFPHRAAGKVGNTPDFMLHGRRKGPAAHKFFTEAPSKNGTPENILIDKNGASASGVQEVNKNLRWFGCPASLQTISSSFRMK
ncbi:DDE-type integrase/transposase/recombinase [Ruegeria sp. Ofav3-42]|uniref:DDE-type integrase/transposase/recombinase n=1 Tax=Ruegeria sp. Ofav3-42 TaxID=2917759 RepID=UPI00351CFC0A